VAPDATTVDLATTPRTFGGVVVPAPRPQWRVSHTGRRRRRPVTGSVTRPQPTVAVIGVIKVPFAPRRDRQSAASALRSPLLNRHRDRSA
jgi:hypothetical protein